MKKQFMKNKVIETKYIIKNNYVPGIIIACIVSVILLLCVLLSPTPSHYKPNKIELDTMVIAVDGHRFYWFSFSQEWKHDVDCAKCKELRKEAL